jgi:Ni,Fe-hydrogenase III large subunit
MLLRASEAAFGHRLLMDCVVPGGIAVDLSERGREVILRALGEIASGMQEIRSLHDAPALANRLRGVGRVEHALAASLGIGGVVGLASGRMSDVLAGYAARSPGAARRRAGDAASRQVVRLTEIEANLRLVGTALETLQSGPLTVALPPVSGEGIGRAGSVRGDVWHWLRLDHGPIATRR